MKKKILLIILGILLITAILLLIIFFVKNKEIPVEKFMADETWEEKQEQLKLASKHNWKVYETGEVKCTHCDKFYRIGDSIKYKPKFNSAKIVLGKELTGYSEDQLVTREKTTWVVLGATEDGKGILITTDKPLNQKDSVIFRGAQAYNTGVEVLNAVARELYSNSKYGYARCMTIEDVNDYLGFENPSTQYTYIETDNSGNIEKKESGPEIIKKGKWRKIDNLTTKIKDLSIFESIIKNGTYTPDGTNTKESLGEYCLNGYSLQTSGRVENGKCMIRVFGIDEVFEVDAEKQDFIFGIHEDNLYTYWLASRGVAVSNDFVAFGMGMIQKGSASSCVEMYDSRNEIGLFYTADLKPGIRPVVELYVIDY